MKTETPSDLGASAGAGLASFMVLDKYVYKKNGRGELRGRGGGGLDI